MRFNSVELVYFSPTGGTRRIVEWIGRALQKATPDSKPVVAHDLLSRPPAQDLVLSPDSLLVAGMPVYAGRIPPHCLPLLRRFKGRHSPALAVAVLRQPRLRRRAVGTAQRPGRQRFCGDGRGRVRIPSLGIPPVAADRPDADDERVAEEFARRCAARLADMGALSRDLNVTVKGNTPYKELKPGGPRPDVDHTECIQCGACVDICPVNALSVSGPTDAAVVRDMNLCMGCAACIQVCPTGAQAWRGPQYEAMSAVFAENAPPGVNRSCLCKTPRGPLAPSDSPVFKPTRASSPAKGEAPTNTGGSASYTNQRLVNTPLCATLVHCPPPPCRLPGGRERHICSRCP